MDVEQRYRAEIAKNYRRPQLPEAFTDRLDISRLTLSSLFIRLRVRAPRPTIKPSELPNEISVQLTSRQRRQLTEIAAERSSIDSLGRMNPELREKIEEWLTTISGSESLDLAQALLRNRQLVITGIGGSGKTTLMRWLALVCAENRHRHADVLLGPAFDKHLLPIIINLSAFAAWIDRNDAGIESRQRHELLARFVAQRTEHDPACYQVLLDAMDRGEAIVLTDGLDEILDQHLRERTVAFIQGFIGDEVGQRCFVIVTSRPYACPQGLFGDEIGYFELLPFRPKDVRTYLVSHWYPAAYGPTLSAEAEALATEIAETPPLARLAINPLLCTLLAVIYRAGLQPLPKRRIIVFEECCKLLIHRWDENRAIPWPQGCAEETKLRLGARLAYSVLSESPDLCLAEDRARSLATQHLRNALNCSEDEAGQAAEALLRSIRDRAGLIESRGDSSYQFIIRPFLDYLASRHIAAVEDNEKILDMIVPHMFDSEWREPIVMAAARMARNSDTFPKMFTLLQTMLEVMQPPPWPRGLIAAHMLPRAWRDRWLESRLLRLESLTAQIIGDEIGKQEETINELRALSTIIVHRCSGFLNRDDFLSRNAAEVLGRLVAVEAEAEGVLIKALQSARASTRRLVAQELGNPEISERALNTLGECVGQDDTALRKIAIEAIGTVGRFTSLVVSQLTKAAHDEDDEIRAGAIETLSQVGELSPEFAEFLVNYLDAGVGINYQPGPVRCAAAKALSSADPMTPNLIDTLIRTLDDADTDVRKAAVQTLGHLASSSKSVMETLLRILEVSEWWVRCEIVRMLGVASRSSNQALNGVLSAANDKVSNVRRSAIEVLRDLEIREEAAVNVLFTAVSDENFWVSLTAIIALSSMGLISEGEKDLLILERRQAYVRDPGNAAFLGLMGLVPPESAGIIAENLVQVAQRKNDFRYVAMRRLGEMTRSNPELEPVLINALRDINPDVRQAAADALVSTGRQIPEAVPHLLYELRSKKKGDKEDTYAWHRVSAMQALTVVGTSTPEVLSTLYNALRDEEGKIRREAAQALGHFARSSENARDMLRQCLRHKDSSIRKIAVQNLASENLWSSDSPDILIRSVRDRSVSVRAAAAQILQRALAKEQKGLAVHAMPIVKRLTKWMFQPSVRSLLLPVLASDPNVAESQVFDSYLNRIASGLRSVFPSVRREAYAALINITRNRALPSFRWYTVEERQLRRDRRAWRRRVILAILLAFLVFELAEKYAENTLFTGTVTLLSFVVALLPIKKIIALLRRPQGGAKMGKH